VSLPASSDAERGRIGNRKVGPGRPAVLGKRGRRGSLTQSVVKHEGGGKKCRIRGKKKRSSKKRRSAARGDAERSNRFGPIAGQKKPEKVFTGLSVRLNRHKNQRPRGEMRPRSPAAVPLKKGTGDGKRKGRQDDTPGQSKQGYPTLRVVRNGSRSNNEETFEPDGCKKSAGSAYQKKAT